MNRLPRGLSFAVLCAVSLALWFRSLLDTLVLAASDESYTHILLILPVAVALILQSWREQCLQPRSWSPAVGLLMISILVGVSGRWGSVAGKADLRLAIEMAALILWWIASFVFCFGPSAFRSFRFPLLFLFWMVPIPRFAVTWIVAELQRGSALAAYSLFWIFRFQVAREGTSLLLPGLTLEVAPECSSIRSSLMLVVTTLVLAHLLLKTPWRKAVLVLLTVPLSVAKNGLRIFLIGMLATRVDRSFLTGRLHREGGIVFFLIALVIMLLPLWIMRRGEGPEAPTPPLTPAKP